MKLNIFIALSLFFFIVASSSCKEAGKKTGSDTDTTATAMRIKEDNVSYTGDGVTMNGYVAYDESKEGPRPAVLVIHEWWGINDHVRQKAKQLAELGYIAMAIDLYGNGKIADNPDSALHYAMPFYKDPQMTRERYRAAVSKLLSYTQADSTRMAAIGFCFGGSQALNMARLGENLDAVVSFHGGLLGVPPDKNLLKAEVLVCHGAADSFVPQTEVDQFKKQMDSIGARYTFKAYEGAKHAFTNPDATATGQKFKIDIAYNAAADSASWNDMKSFFDRALK
jgi:dienelactone hydrolase